MVIIFTFIPLFTQETPERTARKHLITADSLFIASNFTLALEHYQASLKLYRELDSDLTPFNEEISTVLYKLYATTTNNKNYQLAAQFGEEYLIYNPSDEAVIRNLALIYRQLNNTTKAIEVWQKYDQVYDNYNAKIAIADLYEKTNDIPNALIWYNKGLEVNKDPDVVRRVAKLYIDSNQPQKAIQFYDDFIATNPNRRALGTTYRNMGKLYEDMKNITKAIEKYELALEIEYDRSLSLWLANEYYHQPNFPKAKQHVSNMIQKNANDADAIRFTGLMLYDEKKFAEAKNEFQKILNHRTYGAQAQDFIKRIDNQNR